MIINKIKKLIKKLKIASQELRIPVIHLAL